MITDLKKLKLCTTRADLIKLLGINSKHFHRTLYAMQTENCYRKIEIPKKNSCKKRKIYIPDPYLSLIQKKLSNLLTTIFEEICIEKSKKTVSFAFRKNSEEKQYGIYQNARQHINKKVVLNVDLENFFENITFSRVVGFFMKNKNFSLTREVAITIAQIVCIRIDGKVFLPQGSPTSPIISNLIGEIIDSKITKLQKEYKFTYTRYADDLTLSFTYKNVSEDIFYITPKRKLHKVGKVLEEAIVSSGFSVNKEKTRIQFQDCRQSVTGLTVNSKVNINQIYYKNTKAMGLRYCMYNEFWKSPKHVLGEKIPSATSLVGIFNYIHYIKKSEIQRAFNTLPQLPQLPPKPYNILECLHNMNSFSRMFLKVIFHKRFIYSKKIQIICEGKTDTFHLKQYAKNQNINFYHFFAFKEQNPSFFAKELRIGSGTDSLGKFIEVYSKLYLSKKKLMLPTIILVDSDKDGNNVFLKAEKLYPKTYTCQIDTNLNIKHAFVLKNLYIVQIPSNCVIDNKKIECIEDLYSNKILNKKINGRTLSKKNKIAPQDKNKFYSKNDFFDKNIKDQKGIDLKNFEILFEMINRIHHINMIKNFAKNYFF